MLAHRGDGLEHQLLAADAQESLLHFAQEQLKLRRVREGGVSSEKPAPPGSPPSVTLVLPLRLLSYESERQIRVDSSPGRDPRRSRTECNRLHEWVAKATDWGTPNLDPQKLVELSSPQTEAPSEVEAPRGNSRTWGWGIDPHKGAPQEPG